MGKGGGVFPWGNEPRGATAGDTPHAVPGTGQPGFPEEVGGAVAPRVSPGKQGHR